MAVQYILMRPIMDLCEEAVLRPGMQAYKRWWEHEELELEGKQTNPPKQHNL